MKTPDGTMKTKKFKAVVATSNQNQPDPFSEKDLEEMAMKNIPPAFALITNDFNCTQPIGKAIFSEKIGDKVILTGEIVEGLKGYIVPGGAVKRDKNGKIEKFIVNQYAFTTKPTDKSLTPLEYIKKETN